MLKLENNEMFGNILNHICAGVLYCKNDNHSTILYANDYFYQMIGYTKEEVEEIYENRFADMVVDDVSEILAKIVGVAIENGEDLDFEYRMRKKDGSIIWMHDTARYDKENNCFYVTLMEITAKKSMEWEKERLHNYLYYLPNKIMVFETDGTIIYKNKKAQDCEYFDSSITNIAELVEPYILGNDFHEVETKLKEGENITYEMRYRDDSSFIGHDSNCIIPIKDKHGKIVNYIQVSENILNNDDHLTKFPTRIMFETYYEKMLARKKDMQAFLCIIDIDNFKSINDTYGHSIGDEAIKVSGGRLLQCVGKEDYICRYGGDEFLLLLLDVEERSVMERLQTFMELAKNPITIHDNKLMISYSIGIAGTNAQSVPYLELFCQADSALYKVKTGGKGHMKLYKGK